MISNILFQNATQEDLSEIQELLRTCDLPIDDIELYLSNFLVARIQDQIVACIGLERYNEIALLRSLAVRSDFRGHGIAMELCRRLEVTSPETLYLLTTAAADFFKRIGYEKLDRSEAPSVIKNNKQFTTLCPSTAVLMRKIL
jgi:amino-acid N-acetyltransferase